MILDILSSLSSNDEDNYLNDTYTDVLLVSGVFTYICVKTLF